MLNKHHTNQSRGIHGPQGVRETMKYLKRDEKGELSIGKIIGVVILVIVGLLMLPIVQDSVYDAQQNENTTDTQSSLLDMVTVFYVLGIALAAIMWVVHEAKGFSGK